VCVEEEVKGMKEGHEGGDRECGGKETQPNNWWRRTVRQETRQGRGDLNYKIGDTNTSIRPLAHGSERLDRMHIHKQQAYALSRLLLQCEQM